MPEDGTNYNKAKVKTEVILVPLSKPFQGFLVVLLVLLTDPHVKVAFSARVSAFPARSSRTVMVVAVIILEGVVRVMTAHADLGSLADLVSFLHRHLNISGTTRWIAVNVVII